MLISLFLDVTKVINFSASDPDGNPLVYDVFIGLAGDALDKISSAISETEFELLHEFQGQPGLPDQQVRVAAEVRGANAGGELAELADRLGDQLGEPGRLARRCIQHLRIVVEEQQDGPRRRRDATLDQAREVEGPRIPYDRRPFVLRQLGEQRDGGRVFAAVVDDEDIILSKLPDDELVEQVHYDLYDGLAEEVAEGTPCPVETATRDEIIAAIQMAGVVGLGGAAFPTHVKLAIPEGKHARWLLINGCECEPYLTSDHRIMLEWADSIFLGVRVLARILGAEKSFIAVETNKWDAIKTLVSRIPADLACELVPLETKYPQGAEKMLIKAVLDQEVPSGKLPIDVHVLVQNVGTVAGIGDFFAFGQPLIERVVTVTGNGVARPRNLLALVGTPIAHLVELRELLCVFGEHRLPGALPRWSVRSPRLLPPASPSLPRRPAPQRPARAMRLARPRRSPPCQRRRPPRSSGPSRCPRVPNPTSRYSGPGQIGRASCRERV